MANRALSSCLRRLECSRFLSKRTLPDESRNIQARTFATETSLPDNASVSIPGTLTDLSGRPLLPQQHLSTPLQRRPAPPPRQVTTTIYDFPTFEPLYFTNYPASHLHVPLRQDLLHRAIVFEGHNARQGTANSKWRNEVHGSGRKIRPQKGMGMARLGDKKSPMLKGGGRAWPKKPRDWSTLLPRKIYDIAWRTALSYRYRRGQLIVVRNFRETAEGEKVVLEGSHQMRKLLMWNHIGSDDGRSMWVARKNPGQLLELLNTGFKGEGGEHAEVKADWEVDVKDLLTARTLVIEKRALDALLAAHSSDLDSVAKCATYE